MKKYPNVGSILRTAGVLVIAGLGVKGCIDGSLVDGCNQIIDLSGDVNKRVRRSTVDLNVNAQRPAIATTTQASPDADPLAEYFVALAQKPEDQLTAVDRQCLDLYKRMLAVKKLGGANEIVQRLTTELADCLTRP